MRHYKTTCEYFEADPFLTQKKQQKKTLFTIRHNYNEADEKVQNKKVILFCGGNSIEMGMPHRHLKAVSSTTEGKFINFVSFHMPQYQCNCNSSYMFPCLRKRSTSKIRSVFCLFVFCCLFVFWSGLIKIKKKGGGGEILFVGFNLLLHR